MESVSRIEYFASRNKLPLGWVLFPSLAWFKQPMHVEELQKSAMYPIMLVHRRYVTPCVELHG